MSAVQFIKPKQNPNGLKPCPFCGRNPILKMLKVGFHYVSCWCGIETPYSKSVKGAKAKWNRRNEPLGTSHQRRYTRFRQDKNILIMHS